MAPSFCGGAVVAFGSVYWGLGDGVLMGVARWLVFKAVAFRLLGLGSGVCVRIWVEGKVWCFG